jgi:hypothetical protein
MLEIMVRIIYAGFCAAMKEETELNTTREATRY